jgi:hypothetical protein
LKDTIARLSLAATLAKFGDLSGYPDVVTGVKSSVGFVQGAAANDLITFVKICPPCDVSPQPMIVALQLLDEPAASVRLSAAIAIAARLGDDPRSEVALRKLAAQDSDSLVRNFATTRLKLWSRKMKGKDAGGRQ